MTKTIRNLATAVVALALFATACGGGQSTQTSAETDAALDKATTNLGSLVTSNNLAETQMLDVRDGNLVSLSEVVTGDRAVLLWYWAPH